MSQSSDSSVCLSCGACCAYYRVSFYWAESVVREIPDRLVEPLSAVMACMAGTHSKTPRCQALVGSIGARVHCGIYPNRPEACREVQPGDEKCLRARAHHGLGPISPPHDRGSNP